MLGADWEAGEVRCVGDRAGVGVRLEEEEAGQGIGQVLLIRVISCLTFITANAVCQELGSVLAC